MSKAARPERFRDGWRVRWLDADGKRRSKLFERCADAQKYLDARRTEAERIRVGVDERPPEPHTFDELCTYWIDHRTAVKRSQKDDKSIIEAHLRPALGGLLLAQVSVDRVNGYTRGRRHLSPKTIHNHLTLLIAMLNYAVDLGWLRHAPRIKKPRLVEQEYGWLRTTEEIRKLLVAAQDEDAGVMELYAAAVYTGMRAGELLGLRWEDVNFDEKVRLITVKRSYDKPTKTGSIRHVPILDPLLPVLRAWKLRCGSHDLVFPNPSGTMRQPSARVLQETFQACLVRAKLVEAVEPVKGRRRESAITFHDLRHTFASHWVMAGKDIFKLQKILGHKSVQMTQRYAHLAPDAFSEDWGALKDAVPKGEGEVRAIRGARG
ncbi:MAG: tyrosine-type recombinase/integrase [Myxococcota bacterium]